MDAVISEASTAMVPSAGKFRDRWLSLGDYHQDLLAYILWTHHWTAHREVVDDTVALLAGGDLVAGVKRVACEDLKLMLQSAPERFILLSTAAGQEDDDGQTVTSRYDAMAREAWSGVYRRTLDQRGLKLRPDVSLEEFTDILTALISGITLRALGDQDTAVISHDTNDSLLSKAALMIAAACIDPGDGLGLEEAARRVLTPTSSPDDL